MKNICDQWGMKLEKRYRGDNLWKYFKKNRIPSRVRTLLRELRVQSVSLENSKMKPIKRYLFFTFLENLCLDFLPLKGTHLDLSIENFVFLEDVFFTKSSLLTHKKVPFWWMRKGPFLRTEVSFWWIFSLKRYLFLRQRNLVSLKLNLCI